MFNVTFVQITSVGKYSLMVQVCLCLPNRFEKLWCYWTKPSAKHVICIRARHLDSYLTKYQASLDHIVAAQLLLEMNSLCHCFDTHAIHSACIGPSHICCWWRSACCI